jgi:hypothetical protein
MVMESIELSLRPMSIDRTQTDILVHEREMHELIDKRD